MKAKITILFLLAALIMTTSTLTGCASSKGSTGVEKRAYSQDMRSEALAQLYQLKPDARGEIAAAPGYAVFEAVKAQMLITTTANGYGIVRDNQTGADTYMSAFSAGAGFGAGIKGFRVIVVFQDRQTMNKFVNEGWVFGASGTADAKSDTGGSSVSDATAFGDGMKVYTFTDTGLMAGASLNGVKVWKDEKLN
jgi:lipid-binding SYLF domain-containing protein